MDSVIIRSILIKMKTRSNNRDIAKIHPAAKANTRDNHHQMVEISRSSKVTFKKLHKDLANQAIDNKMDTRDRLPTKL